MQDDANVNNPAGDPASGEAHAASRPDTSHTNDTTPVGPAAESAGPGLLSDAAPVPPPLPSIEAAMVPSTALVPLEPPPLPAAGSPHPPVSRELKWALAGTGAMLLVLSIVVASYAATPYGVSYQVGTVVGVMAVWPAIIIGLFAIGRRFRSPRNISIILLVVWGFAIMGQLGQIHLHRRLAGFVMRGPESSRNSPPPMPSAEPAAPAPTAAPGTASAPSQPFAYDFSRGSDTRLIKAMESAQEDRYRSIVADYARACEQRPGDAVLALERVRFIEKFAYAEDLEIEGADKDLEATKDYLTSRFPDASGTVLFELERTYGPEFETKAQARAASVARWPAPDRAKFFLLRAQHTETESLKRTYARLSFDAEASAEAGLELLRVSTSAGANRETLRLADHAVFRSAEPWLKKQLMDLLFDAADNVRALALYEELKGSSPLLVQNTDTARRLADAGRVAAARVLLAGIEPGQWNREFVLRERFRFELAHGDATQARDAYRALRAEGFGADPLFRERMALLVAHPLLPWSAADMLGLAALVALFGLLLLAPAAVMLPVHYWSLLRVRRGKPGGWPGARWGLRDAWLVLGVFLCVDVACVWYFQPQVLLAKLGRNAWQLEETTMTDGRLLAQQLAAWAAMAAVLGLALWRTRAWRIVGRGSWSWGRTVGLCLAGTMVLRIVLLTYTAIWPASIEGELASLSPMTRQLSLALFKQGGPVALIAAIAVLVPVLEELFFRGVLLQALAKHIPFGWANVGQALLFAAGHENYRILPFFVAFGLLCGVLARRAGGLTPAIAVHACNNFLACIVVMVAAGK
jgi:membrane protease YdiL (CAAX protease family)